jgi:hypothetical protein
MYVNVILFPVLPGRNVVPQEELSGGTGKFAKLMLTLLLVAVKIALFPSIPL